MGIEIELNRNNKISLECFEEGDILDFKEEDKELVTAVIPKVGLSTAKYLDKKIYANGYLLYGRGFVNFNEPVTIEVRETSSAYSFYSSKLVKYDFL